MNAAARAIAGDVDTTTVTISAPPPADSTRRKALAFGIMCLGCFMAYLDTQIVSASIQEIGGGLSASPDELSWIQSSYLIAEIIVIPLSAWLSRVMSTRWLIAASAAGFTLTSLLCGSASDMRAMILFRALQGFLGGSRFQRRSPPPSFCFKASKKLSRRPSSVPPPVLHRRSAQSWAAGLRTAGRGIGCSTSTSFQGC